LAVAGVVFIADAWFVPQTVEIPEGKRPGDMDEREEALHVTAAKRDGSVKTLVTPYKRGPDDTWWQAATAPAAAVAV
jgi:hypothetical protein